MLNILLCSVIHLNEAKYWKFLRQLFCKIKNENTKASVPYIIAEIVTDIKVITDKKIITEL